MKKYRRFIAILLLSLLTVLGLLYLGLISLGLIAPFSVSLSGSMSGNLAAIAPMTPGALGQFEVALIGSPAVFDIPPVTSSLAALLLRTVSLGTFIPVIALVTHIFGFSRSLKLSRQELAAANPSTIEAKSGPFPLES